ncbi:MAG: hypothetical protein ACLVJ6_17090 [Merdibacter sp.]
MEKIATSFFSRFSAPLALVFPTRFHFEEQVLNDLSDDDLNLILADLDAQHTVDLLQRRGISLGWIADNLRSRVAQ